MKHTPGSNGKFNCHCCGYFTLEDGFDGSYEICEVCFWEDDGLQSDDPSAASGANAISLEEARANYKRIGASEEKFLLRVRKPAVNECD